MPIVQDGVDSHLRPISIAELEAGSFPAELLGKLKDKQHIYTIVVRDWLSNIVIAAAAIEFAWDSDLSRSKRTYLAAKSSLSCKVRPPM